MAAPTTPGRPVATAVIADHDPAFRGIVRGAIDPLALILGETDNAESLIVLVRALEPDVVLMEHDLPRGGGMATAWRIKRDQPEIRVILMTTHGEEAFLDATGEAGVDAFLPRKHARREAHSILERVASGLSWDRRRGSRGPRQERA